MFTPDELRALALLAFLLLLGTGLSVLEARHPKILALTLGDSLALGAAPDLPQPVRETAQNAAPESLAKRATAPAVRIPHEKKVHSASTDDWTSTRHLPMNWKDCRGSARRPRSAFSTIGGSAGRSGRRRISHESRESG